MPLPDIGWRATAFMLNDVPVVLIREVLPDDWEVMRDIRLAALREAPYAFGSTYAREAPFTEARWRARISDRAVTYLAYVPGSPSRLASPAATWKTTAAPSWCRCGSARPHAARRPARR